VWFLKLDEIDKALWQELYRNCRRSYQYLANKLGITPNAVRKRIEKLMETGVIVEWTVSLAPAMIDSHYAFIEVTTNDDVDYDKLFNQFFDRPEIYVILPLTSGDYALHALYSGSEGLHELGSFIRQLEGVKESKLHPTTTFNGNKIELSNLDLRVLKFLYGDPRMSISQIAEGTGLTARRVRKIVDRLVDSDAFIFDFTWNPNAGDSMAFIARVEYDDREGSTADIENEIRKTYNLEYFYSHVSAIESVIFSVFMIQHIFDMESIVKAIRKYPSVKAVKPMIYYKATVVNPLTFTKLEEMLPKS